MRVEITPVMIRLDEYDPTCPEDLLDLKNSNNAGVQAIMTMLHEVTLDTFGRCSPNASAGEASHIGTK